MKKVIITCAFLTVAGSMVSFAQTTTTSADPNAAPAQTMHVPMTPEQRADRMTKRDGMMFTLTPEQSKKVYDVELEFATSLEKMRAEGKPPTPEARESIMNKKDAKMKEILTAEQYAKYDVSRNRPHNGPLTPAAQAPAAQPNK